MITFSTSYSFDYAFFLQILDVIINAITGYATGFRKFPYRNHWITPHQLHDFLCSLGITTL